MRINKILAKRVPLVTAFVAFALLVTGCSNKVDNNDNSSNENDYFEDYIEPKATLVNSLEYSGDINNYKIEEYNSNSSDSVYWNVSILKGDKEIQKITQNLDKNASSKPDISELIVEVDVNFDGKKDLLIFQGRFGVQSIASYKCYLNNEEGTSGQPFKILEGFSDIANPSFNHNKKLIQSCNMENANTYVYSIYKITNTKDTSHIVKEASLSIAHKETGLSDCIEYKLKDGNMQIVKEEKDINPQDIYSNDGYFDIGSKSWQSIGKGEDNSLHEH